MSAVSAGAVASFDAKSYAAISGANDRIRLGVIGIGNMAGTHLRNVVGEPDVDVVALCDVYRPHLDNAAGRAPSAATYRDFRRVLDREDVDAVIVGTPDHWHAPITVMACRSGKDVYVEKPSSRTVSEGREMVRVARENQRIVQVGTQQRTARIYARVVELVQSGALGRIAAVRTWNTYRADPAGMRRPSNTDPPGNLDWDMWLGPAPAKPYNPNRFDNWRRFWDYGGGLMTDWGVHHFDIILWAMDVTFPVSVSAVGGNFHFDDNRETPDTLMATYEYPDFVCVHESRYNNSWSPTGHGYGIMFFGEQATLFIDRSRLVVMPEKDGDVPPLEEKGDGNCHAEHLRHFLDCVRSRKLPNCDIATGNTSSAVAMLGNIAYRTGRRIYWNPETNTFDGDPEADAMLGHQYRDPWHL